MVGVMRRNRVRRWLRRSRLYTGRIDQVRYYDTQQDAPNVPPAREISIVGTAEYPKWLKIDCPCGNGHTILLPLSLRTKPHWDLRINQSGEPSIYPSVDRNRHEGVRCHFWLRDGRVRWV